MGTENESARAGDGSYEDTYMGDFPVACRVLPDRFRWTVVRTGTENKAFLDDHEEGPGHFPTGMARICDADVFAFTSGEPDRAFLAQEEPGPLGSRALSLAPNELLYEEFSRAEALGMTLPCGPGEADKEIASAYVGFCLGQAEERTLVPQKGNLARALQSVNGTEFATATPTESIDEMRAALEKASVLRRYRESEKIRVALARVLELHDRPIDVPGALAQVAETHMSSYEAQTDIMADVPIVFEGYALDAAEGLAAALAMERGENAWEAMNMFENEKREAAKLSGKTPRSADLGGAVALAAEREWARCAEQAPAVRDGPALSAGVRRLLGMSGEAR